MRKFENKLIIGIDHGYGNMKTANCCFKTGLIAYDAEPLFTGQGDRKRILPIISAKTKKSALTIRTRTTVLPLKVSVFIRRDTPPLPILPLR